MEIATIVITWSMIQWVGPVLFLLGVVALFSGTLLGNEGSSFGNWLRVITWPSFFVWLAIMAARGWAG